MATTNTLVNLDPRYAWPEKRGVPAGYPDSLPALGTSFIGGLAFPDGVNSYAQWVCRLPATASLGTGLTFKLLVADDPLNADPGKVVKWSVSIAPLATSAYYNPSTGGTNYGTATTGTVTMPSTQSTSAPKTYELSLAILAANVGSGVAASTWCAVRVGRLGADSADTCTGRQILLGVTVIDT